MQTKQLPMFGVTLISQRANRDRDDLRITFRRAGSEETWVIIVPHGALIGDVLSRPGACFALVELASVDQVERRGRF